MAYYKIFDDDALLRIKAEMDKRMDVFNRFLELSRKYGFQTATYSDTRSLGLKLLGFSNEGEKLDFDKSKFKQVKDSKGNYRSIPKKSNKAFWKEIGEDYEFLSKQPFTYDGLLSELDSDNLNVNDINLLPAKKVIIFTTVNPIRDKKPCVIEILSSEYQQLIGSE